MIEMYDKKLSELQQEAQRVSELLAQCAEQKQQLEKQMQNHNSHLLRLDGAMIAINELKEEVLKQKSIEAKAPNANADTEQAVEEVTPAE